MTGMMAVLLSGCAGSAHIEKDDTANFSSYRSFSWLTTKKDRKNDLVQKKISDAVSERLVKAGWKQDDRHPDIYLNYDIAVDRSIRNNSEPVYSSPGFRYLYNPFSRRIVTVYYPPQFLGYERNAESVREGTVTITMIDAKTDKVVWQGWSTGVVNSPNLTSKEIQWAVKNIFKKSDLAKN